MTTEPPLVSVIVPVYNDAARLAACLDALAGQEGGAGCPFEVIVADNGSTDDVAGVVRRYPFAQVVREPRPGSYAARNAAADGSTEHSGELSSRSRQGPNPGSDQGSDRDSDRGSDEHDESH